MQEKGLVPTTRGPRLGHHHGIRIRAEALQLKDGDQVVNLVRLRGTNGQPIVLVNTFLPADYKNIGHLVHEDFVNNSLYNLLETKYGVVIDQTRRILEIRLAGEFDALHLQIDHKAPVQYIETISKADDGTPFEYSRASYRGDLNSFVIEIRKKRI